MSIEYSVRVATVDDLPAITEIQNHYILHTHITFDVRPHNPDDRLQWFREHSGGGRYQMQVACGAAGNILGYACTGRFRTKEAYDPTVEVSIACHPDCVARGVGSSLYTALFRALENQDIHRIVAGVAQPNPASNRLHERFGFRPIGLLTQVGRKFGNYYDVLWMERPFGGN
ncbi:MAG TPA: GNAT family N-acetyltransferase [Candidatus Limnocylindrales bacterium]|nr:GNAT family N-acetyltransferase [Candidatus Limnocylindrales bacterium]